MRNEIRVLAIAALGIAGVGLLYAASARPAVLIIDGASRQISTHARTAAGLLAEAGVRLLAGDQIQPGPTTDLSWDDEAVPVVHVARARPVWIDDDGELTVIYSPEKSALNLLGQAGLTVYPGDVVRVNGLPAGSGREPALIERRNPHPLTVHSDSGTVLIHSYAETVGQALHEAGVVLYEADRLSPGPESALNGPLEVELTSSRPIMVQTSSGAYAGRTAGSTVERALADVGLALQGLDYAIPHGAESLPADGHLRLVRVSEEVQVEQEPLPFETVFQPLAGLEIDQKSLQQAGEYGVLTNRIRIRSEDGVEVGRTVEGERVARDPVPQITGYGTEIVVRDVSTADGALSYWRAVEMYATSYSPSRAGVSPDAPWFGITASGKPLKKGLVAIDRSLIPFGTLMYVPGYGFAEAADTGGGVRGRWIDLGYEDNNWVPWSGYVTVYFLTPVPPPESIVYIFP